MYNAELERINKELKKPFYPEELEWRVGSKKLDYNGNPKIQIFCYVQNRAIMDRLDKVLGFNNWEMIKPDHVHTIIDKTERQTNEMYTVNLNGFITGLRIRIAGEWITRYDGADFTDFEPFKGGLSNSMKRTAVQFGIGRYLYNFENTQAIIHANGENNEAIYNKSTKKKDWFKWSPPILPDWALTQENEEATIEQKYQCAQYFENNSKSMKNWLALNYETMSRNEAYKFIHNSFISDVYKTSIKKDKFLAVSEFSAYFDEILSKSKNTEDKQVKRDSVPVNNNNIAKKSDEKAEQGQQDKIKKSEPKKEKIEQKDEENKKQETRDKKGDSDNLPLLDKKDVKKGTIVEDDDVDNFISGLL